MDPYPSRTPIGPYRLQSTLGQGAMGSVFRAAGSDGVSVALKVLTAESEQGAARFAREARALKRLSHRHVVRFVAAGREGTQAWLAMELVEGIDLEARLEQGPLDPLEARRVMSQVARALAHAHAKGVIHRDLKPSNVLLGDDGRAVVSDFGVARVGEESGLTRTGAMVGTPRYMAPEQIQGLPVGEPADVWALGVMLFHCLTGEPPFVAETLALLIDQIRVARIPPLSGELPPGLESTCLRCLAREPGERPSAREVVGLLAAGAPARQRGPWVAAAVVVGLGLALALGIVLRASPSSSVTPAPSSTSAWRPGAPAGWTTAWRLGEGTSPPVADRSLWTQSGRVVDPLRGARGEGEAALVAAFGGEAEVLSDGRLRVRYRPPDGGPVELLRPGDMLDSREQGSIVLLGDETHVTVPDDRGSYAIRLGRAAWRETSIELEAKALPPHEPGAYRGLTLLLGHPTLSHIGLCLSGRAGNVSVSWAGRRGNAHFVLPPDWTALRFAPGATPGRRVRVGADHPEFHDIDALIVDSPPPGGAYLSVGEERLALRGIAVSGVPLTVDRPALAWAPVPNPPTHCAIAARYQATSDAFGGPRLELGTPSVRYTLQLTSTELSLDLPDRRLARVELAGSAPVDGWLELERAGDVVSGRVRDTQGALVLEVVVQDPLPLSAGELTLGYGSNGPAVRFSDVEVFSGPEDAARRRYDEGTLESETAVETWRAAALELAVTVDPEQAARRWGDLSQAGPARRQSAVAAGTSLERVAAELTDGAKADALARATLAWVVAENPDAAAAAAAHLVELEGTKGAADRIDWLDSYLGLPSTLDQLANGYKLRGQGAPLRIAACNVVLAVEASPAVRSCALQRLADLYELDPATRERALDLLDEAAEVEGGMHVEIRAARVELGLGRPDRAVERLSAVDPGPENVTYHEVKFRAHLSMRQLELAIESIANVMSRNGTFAGQILALAFGGGRRYALNEAPAVRLLLEARPAHSGAFALLLSRLPDIPPAVAQVWRDEASKRARLISKSDSPRDQDLARYVEAAAAQVPAMEEALLEGQAQRPAEVLVRARLGDSDAKRRLAEAGLADTFVQNLARSDETLAEWAQ